MPAARRESSIELQQRGDCFLKLLDEFRIHVLVLVRNVQDVEGLVREEPGEFRDEPRLVKAELLGTGELRRTRVNVLPPFLAWPVILARHELVLSLRNVPLFSCGRIQKPRPLGLPSRGV